MAAMSLALLFVWKNIQKSVVAQLNKSTRSVHEPSKVPAFDNRAPVYHLVKFWRKSLHNEDAEVAGMWPIFGKKDPPP